MSVAIALFTRDLRIRDNAMLAGAHAAADRVLPLFVFDDDMLLRTAHGRPNRFGFLVESLRDLDASLRDRGAGLFVRRGAWVDEVLRVARECEATSVHVARDISEYAQRRVALLAKEIDVVTYDDLTVVPPDALGKPYVVFTPYYKRWLDQPFAKLAPLPRRLTAPDGIDAGSLPAGASPGSWEGGETAGLAQLKAWTASGLRDYADTRDNPARDETARISPYLHFGCLSASEIAQRLWDRPGAEAFVRQICWRDFYAQLLWYRPEVAHADIRRGAPRWHNAPGDLETWKAGRTGFPFVDAGMRQLRAEGWMHNRVRMVVASFLTKDLLIDWRAGAAHFMDVLVDGDVAQNQLNWQWVAGTGTDANPFRVMNPTVQGRKHDRDGAYVRRWIPELRDVPAEIDVHDPPFDFRRAVGYPEPILDHAEAIEVWRAARDQLAAMPKREFTVAKMRRDEEPAVIGALSRAFYDDPMFGYFLPNLVNQMKGITGFMGAGVKDAKSFNEIHVAHVDGKVACAAVWLPPGAYPRGARRDVQANLRSFPVIARAGRRSLSSLQLMNTVDKAHHAIHEPHYYLAILGTDPLYQRSGAGSAALAPVLERCDTEGVSAYLETQKEDNLAYYARHSFELIEKLEVGDVPPLWTMIRKPR